MGFIPYLATACYVNLKSCLTSTISLPLQNKSKAVVLHAAKQRY